MRILILTCNTGGGHNSAALALESYFQKSGIQCDIADFLGFGKSFANNIICNGHVFIYRHAPKLFDWGYKRAENGTLKGENSFLYKYCSLYSDNLYKFLSTHKYDCVVSVHIFASIALDYIKKRMDSKIFACNVSTDYTCYPEINNTDLDLYFIAHEDLKNEYVRNGIKSERLVASGIPVREVFYETRRDKESAKKLIGVDPKKKTVLVVGGSMGAGPIEETIATMTESLGGLCTVAAICGSNEKLYDSLSKYQSVHLRGFVSNIEHYMNAADVILTKAGGLTSTEAAAMSLPPVFVDAVAGCENYNRIFFENHGYALLSNSVSEAISNTRKLLEDEGLYNEIHSKLEKDFAAPAQEIICNTLRQVF